MANEALMNAKKMARDNGCFIVTLTDKYLLYRQNSPKNLCIGSSKTIEGICRLVKKSCAKA